MRGNADPGFIRLTWSLLREGYSDDTVCQLSRTGVIRSLTRLSMSLGWLLPFRNRSSMFFFFPFLHVGGAERVHGALTNCMADWHPWIFFTKHSETRGFQSLFPKRARLFNLWFLFKYAYPFSIGVMAGFINRHLDPVAFGSNSLFYYLLLPYLRPGVRKIDLLHAFGGGTEEFSLPAVNVLDTRVVITSRTKKDLATQYRDRRIDPKLLERVVLIQNCVNIPPTLPPRSRGGKLGILYVGRATEEKRVHLVGRIAALCAERSLPVTVTLVGDIAPESINAESRSACLFTGEIHDPTKMEELYSASDMLLVTSSREGFPLVIMEAMAHGVVPVSTAVGGIPEHIHHGENGWLIGNHDDENRIVENAYSLIVQACSDRQQLEKMSHAAYGYAVTNFSTAHFCKAYRQLLIPTGCIAHA